MKKKILCLAMMVLMLVGVPLNAYAQDYEGASDWSVTFDGSKLKSNFDSDELSESVSKLQPGDGITLTVSLKNNYANRKTDWYMSNKVLKSLEDDSVATKGAYSYKLCYYNPEGKETVLYDSDSVGGEVKSGDDEGLHEAANELEDYFYLDRLSPSEKAKVTLYVKLEGETQGNDYQKTLAKLRMNFAVEKVYDKVTVKEVSKNNIEYYYTSKMVKTGDVAPVALFSVVALVSGLALLAAAVKMMKKRNIEKGE